MATGATEYVDVTNADVYRPTIWSGFILHAYRSKLGFIDLINRQLEGDAKVGKAVKVGKITQLTTRSKSAETAVTWEANTETDVTINLDQHQYVAFQVEDIVRVQAHANLLAEYTNEIGYALKKKQNQDVLGLVDGFTQTGGVLGNETNEAGRLTAVRTLDGVDVDTDNPDQLTWVLSGAEYYAWLAHDEIKNSLYSGSHDVLKRARLREIYGGMIWKSNVVVANGAGHDCALVHRDALTLVQQMSPRVKTEWIIENISQAVVADTIYGYGELRDEGGYWLKAK
jgi:hypothetical protein